MGRIRSDESRLGPDQIVITVPIEARDLLKREQARRLRLNKGRFTYGDLILEAARKFERKVDGK